MSVVKEDRSRWLITYIIRWIPGWCRNLHLNPSMCVFKVVTRRKFTTTDNYEQLIYGWKDFFSWKKTNNLLKNHEDIMERRKMRFSKTPLRPLNPLNVSQTHELAYWLINCSSFVLANLYEGEWLGSESEYECPVSNKLAFDVYTGGYDAFSAQTTTWIGIKLVH